MKPSPAQIEPPFTLDRRRLLTGTAALIAAGSLAPLLGRAGAAVGEPIKTEPWGQLVPLGEGIWAVVSTPLEARDFTTVCNGGIVAGKERVLVVESFANPKGARWVADAARELTGRWPTDVVITHYHGDHAAGLAGLVNGDDRPRVHITPTTLDRLNGGDDQEDTPEARTRGEMLAAATHLDEATERTLDLGGVEARLRPWSGHTDSDVTIDLAESGIVFGGDLVWNRMIPNFVDASPMALTETLRALAAERLSTYVPGHGPLADGGILDLNLALLQATEEVGRRSFEAGAAPADAAAEVELAGELGEWTAFQPTYLERALTAWHRDLGAAE
jgi:glyoxylase-like metal-dependent hydrolase (beta-lactamase superfamily II)